MHYHFFFFVKWHADSENKVLKKILWIRFRDIDRWTFYLSVKKVVPLNCEYLVSRMTDMVENDIKLKII